MERPQIWSTISDRDSVRFADGNGGDPAVKFRLGGNYRATDVPDWATHGHAQFALVALDCANSFSQAIRNFFPSAQNFDLGDFSSAHGIPPDGKMLPLNWPSLFTFSISGTIELATSVDRVFIEKPKKSRICMAWRNLHQSRIEQIIRSAISTIEDIQRILSRTNDNLLNSNTILGSKMAIPWEQADSARGYEKAGEQS